jgi:hypothetical protein
MDESIKSTQIETGWIDTVTGKSGTFDKDGKPREYTRWERLRGIWTGFRTQIAMRKAEKEIAARKLAEEKRLDEEAWQFCGTWPTQHGHVAVYINHKLKEAYFISHFWGKVWISYEAVTISHRVIPMKYENQPWGWN